MNKRESDIKSIAISYTDHEMRFLTYPLAGLNMSTVKNGCYPLKIQMTVLNFQKYILQSQVYFEKAELR